MSTTFARKLNLLCITGVVFVLTISPCSTEAKQRSLQVKTEIRLALLYPFPEKNITDITDILQLTPFVGAFELARQAVSNASSLLPSISLPLIWNDTKWSSSVALRALTEQWRSGADAFIGPGNYQGFCNTSARLAAAWNLPLVSYLCTEDVVSKKNLFPTFVRTKAPTAQLSKSIVAVLNKFKWRKVAVLYSVEDEYWKGIAEDMSVYLRQHNKTVTYHAALPIVCQQGSCDEVLTELDKKARIIILVVRISEVPQFMDAAHRKGMTNGKYVFIASDFNHEKQDIQKRGCDWLLRGKVGKWQQRVQSYHSVLILLHRSRDVKQWERFKRQVAVKQSEYPFNIQETTIAEEEAANLYDAVFLYAVAINRTLAKGQNTRNGTAVVRNILNRSFDSIKGYQVYVDANGDTGVNMTLFDYQPVDKNALREANQSCDSVMKQVGQFKMVKDQQILEIDKQGTVYWSSNLETKPPTDEVPHKDTEPEGLDSLVLIMLGITCTTITVSFIAVASVVYRRKKYERELMSLLWKVDYGELVFRNAVNHHLSRRSILSDVSDTVEASNISRYLLV